MTVIEDAPTYTPDTVLWPAIDDLANCLCAELIRSGLPPLCFCGVIAGDPAFDVTEDDRGFAWVRVVSVAPTTTFPQPDLSVRNCAAYLMVQVEVGVMRCFPGALTGDMPTVAEQWEASRLQMADMAAMHRAILCCSKKGSQVVLGAYSPLGPDGGWVGGVWQVYLSGV